MVRDNKHRPVVKEEEESNPVTMFLMLASILSAGLTLPECMQALGPWNTEMVFSPVHPVASS